MNPSVFKITEETYQAAIPGCCRLRTFEEHAEILMLCWGITRHIHNGNEGPMSPCGICEFNAEPAGAAERVKYDTDRAKDRMWNTLKGKHSDI